MANREKPQISSRKQPRQVRSAGLVSAIVEAAAQVLARDGAARFTTARVAEKAGVSIGSLYQYFPNKAAILFRLQSDEWQQTTAMLCAILQQANIPPADRLRLLVHAFVRSECVEAEMRTALHDAAPLYRDAPEARVVRANSAAVFETFLDEALPQTPPAKRLLVGDLIRTMLSQGAKHFSAEPRTEEEIASYAEAMADMFCAYLDRLTEGPAAGSA